MNQMKASLTASLIPMVPVEITEAIAGQIQLTMQAMQLSMLGTLNVENSVKDSSVKRGFGNLVIAQTMAYACRLLFKQLKRSVFGQHE